MYHPGALREPFQRNLLRASGVGHNVEQMHFRHSGRKRRFEASFQAFCKMLNGGQNHIEPFSG
jgi:hypothetical protein